MSTEDRALGGAAAPPGRVLLEHSVTLEGRPLALSVTRAEDAGPDTVTVHVRYGGGRAEVSVSADAASSEGGGQASGSGGPASAAGQDARPSVECSQAKSSPSGAASGKRAGQAVCPDVSSTNRQHRDRVESSVQTETAVHGEDSAEVVASAGSGYLPTEILQRIFSFLTWQQALGVRRVTRHWRDAVDACLSRRTELRIGRFDFPAILDDATLAKMLRAMPALRCLSVERRPDSCKLDIDTVSQHCRNLVEVDLAQFRLDAWSLKPLCRACPGLAVVKLPRESDDSCVEALLHNLPKLLSLDLTQTGITGRFLGTGHDWMQTLCLAGCGNIDFSFLNHLQHSATKGLQMVRWPKMQELDLTVSIKEFSQVNAMRLFPPLKRFSSSHQKFVGATLMNLSKHLRDLTISSSKALHRSFLTTALTRCPQLERLSMAHSGMIASSDPLELDQSLILRLRELDVSDVTGLATADLAIILAASPDLRCLRAARFAKLDLTVCMTSLSRCPELRQLDVSFPVTQATEWRPTLRMRRSQVTGDRLGHSTLRPSVLSTLLSDCQKLERLLMARCHIDPSSFVELAQGRELLELDLSRVTVPEFKTDWPVEAATKLAQGLSGCLALERLSLTGLTVSLGRLLPPTGLPKLTFLDVSGSRLTNDSLRRLPGLFPRLSSLTMPDNMEGARLNKTVDGDGLNNLARLQCLRSLDIRGVSGVTDALLEKLAKRPLTRLRLDGPTMNEAISTRGIARLVQDCQSLRFIFLDESQSVDAIHVSEKQLPLHRVVILVLCVVHKGREQDQAAEGDQTIRRRLVYDLPPGSVSILSPDVISWADSADCIV